MNRSKEKLKRNMKALFNIAALLILILIIVLLRPLYTQTLNIKSVGAAEIKLYWKADKSAESYNIYRKDKESGDYLKIEDIKENEYRDTGLSPETTYWYKISRVKGGKEGELSRAVKVTTRALPAAPENIDASEIDYNSLEIKWDKVKGAGKYRVYRSDGKYSRFVLIGESEETNYKDTQLRPTTQYWYKVTTLNEDGESKFSTMFTATTEEKVNIQGNTGGNIMNDGLAAAQGDWIYYKDNPYGGALYKYKMDGSSKVKLLEGEARYVNVVGEWIYYTLGFGKTLYKMRIDGTNNTIINQVGANDICVDKDWIYYLDSQLKMYRMKPDGSNTSALSETTIIDFIVQGDWIYYRDTSAPGPSRIFKMKTDGSEKTKLANGAYSNIAVDREWIYYSTGKRGEKLYKIKIDGAGNTKIGDINTVYLNVYDGWIYYCDINDNGSLYRMRTDGSQVTKLNNIHTRMIHIVNGYILYYTPYGVEMMDPSDLKILPYYM